MGNEDKSVWERLLAGVNSLVQLKIITYIGEVEISGDFCSPELHFPDGRHKAIVTCVNLAAGDITSCFPEQYASEQYAWLRTYHDAQVKQGKDIVASNLGVIGQFGKDVAAAIKEFKEAGQ